MTVKYWCNILAGLVQLQVWISSLLNEPIFDPTFTQNRCQVKCWITMLGHQALKFLMLGEIGSRPKERPTFRLFSVLGGIVGEMLARLSTSTFKCNIQTRLLLEVLYQMLDHLNGL